MSKPTIRIFGVPMDLGQNRRGVDMGPSAIRYARLQQRLARLGYRVEDGGNVPVQQIEEVDDLGSPYRLLPEGGYAHHVPEIAVACREVHDLALCCIEEDDHVIFLGGDHAMSIGTVAAVSQRGSVGVVWVDAHADINTPRSTPSGNVHGMVIATLLGDGPRDLVTLGGPGPKIGPEQVAYIGLRDLDPPERERLQRGDILAITMRDIDEHGIAPMARRVVEHLASFPRIHVSLDLDGLDPGHAPGVGTPVPGGLSYREAHLLMEILGESGKVGSLDIVEINPILDQSNGTAELAVELAATLFGQRIL